MSRRPSASEIREAFEEALREPPVCSNHDIRVTDVVDPCLRRAYFRHRYGTTKTRRMVEGATAHREVLDRVGFELGCAVEAFNRKVIGNVWLVGRADLYCGDYVVEFKTSSTPYVRRSWLLQLHAYMWLFDVEYGFIVVLHDNGLKVYEDELNEEYVEEIKRNALVLAEALRKDQPPEGNRTVCNECEFKQMCRPNAKLF